MVCTVVPARVDPPQSSPYLPPHLTDSIDSTEYRSMDLPTIQEDVDLESVDLSIESECTDSSRTDRNARFYSCFTKIYAMTLTLHMIMDLFFSISGTLILYKTHKSHVPSCGNLMMIWTCIAISLKYINWLLIVVTIMIETYPRMEKRNDSAIMGCSLLISGVIGFIIQLNTCWPSAKSPTDPSYEEDDPYNMLSRWNLMISIGSVLVSLLYLVMYPMQTYIFE